MKEKIAILLVGFGCVATFAAVPTVSNVHVEQDKMTREVTVTYDLDADAVVTADFMTNGVSIGTENYTNAVGTMNCRVAAGTGRTITWRPDRIWPDHQITEKIFGVRVRAWALNAPPPYMVADVENGEVRYYVSAEVVPGGISNEVYKTRKLLFRLISANRREFTMGAPASIAGDYASHETLHQVTLTNDFYLGVYETTQRQWELVKGNRPSVANNDTYYQMRPVENVSYQDIRGSTLGLQWPANDAVDADSFLGVLRERTGVRFDLPTDAQWEYACKAGTMTALYIGTNTVNAATLNPIARNANNGGGNWSSGVGTNGATAVVGTYLPNSFGLYDMIGNVYEWCIDRCPSNAAMGSEDAIDPLGIATATDYRVKHGGSAEGSPPSKYLRATYRGMNTSNTRHRSMGFRVALRLY
ncbi:MAG: formylglycine-generating enzyme family protein [Kiritimatiellae bacterium]|nr:formylglycine-generating enzyme family protein [Kiritimatiellia bacterium]